MPKGGSTLGESKKWERKCGEGERKATKGWEGVRTENQLTQKSGWRNTTHTSKHTPNITHPLPKGGSTLGESKKWERKCGEGKRKATKGWEGVRTENQLTQNSGWRNTTAHSKTTPNITHHLPKGGSTLGESKKWERNCGEGERKATKGWEGVRTENLLTQKSSWRNTTHTSKHTPNITHHLPKGGSTLGESKKWERKCGEGAREASKGWEGVRTENLLTQKSG